MKKLLLALAMASTMVLGACDDEGPSFSVSEQQIEQRLQGYFPFHREALLGQLRLDLAQPDLILANGSERAELVLQSKITAAGSVWPGNVKLSFGLDYDNKTGTFYLIEPRVQNLNTDGVPQTVSNGMVKYLLPLVQQYLTRVPIYTLKSDASTTQNVARKTLKKVAIKDKQVKVYLGWNE